LRFLLHCNSSQDLEAMRQMAESLIPIEPDDTRVDISTDVGPINEEE
jgi:hypothetical protein